MISGPPAEVVQEQLRQLREKAAADAARIEDLQLTADTAMGALIDSQQDRADLRAKLEAVPIGFAATGVTDAQGEVTFELPAGRFPSPPVCQVTVQRDTTLAAAYPLSFLRTVSTVKVLVRVAESKTSSVIGVGAAEGLETAPAGLIVHLYARMPG